MDFMDRINEKNERIRQIESAIIACAKIFLMGAGIAFGGGILLCLLALIC